MSARPPPSLKARALACIARREHSPAELRRKLLEHARRRQPLDQPDRPDSAVAEREVAEREVDALIDWLAARDLLSTARFVETRVHARAARFGNLRIRHELAQHGLRLEEGLARSLDSSELQRARAVWVKRFGAPAVDAAGRARQIRFLGARGFSVDVVRRVVTADGTAGDTADDKGDDPTDENRERHL